MKKILLIIISIGGYSANCYTQSSVVPMVWIPPGKFMMGSPVSEPGRKADEGPQDEVRISRGYWMGKTEVTIGQWKTIMGESFREHVVRMLNDETIYDFGEKKQKLREYMNFDPNEVDNIIANENEELPMYFVSWHDAIAFCAKLTEQEKEKKRLPKGYQYSLPTEAQWEYACRAGTTAATYADDLERICWYGGNSAVGYKGRKLGRAEAGPRNVATKEPNAWGLYDMLGNIWEWCSDDYGAGKINRGGSWGSGPNAERSAARAGNPPAEKSAYRGFRIVLTRMR